jgi:hypothetical protein
MIGSLIISAAFNSCAVTLCRMLELKRGVAVNSTMAQGLTRTCISRVRPVTALWASSTIISGRWTCSRLANEKRGLPVASVEPFTCSSPAMDFGTELKCGSMFSLWA